MENLIERGREVRDWRGRIYLTGFTPGRPRSSMLWAAWAAMAAIGVLQYGYGATLPTVAAAHGWSLGQALWLLAGWTLCQAVIGLPTAALMERRRLRPRVTMLAGAALSAVGPIALAHAPDHFWAFAGYSLLSGLGGGLVYATCSSVVAKWFPERSAARVSLVTGAFAYGAVPLVIAVQAAAGPAAAAQGSTAVAAVLDGTAGVVFVVVAVAGLLFRDPPANWWPEHIDPRAWAVDGRLNPGLRTNPRAVREFSAGEALRTPSLLAMAAILVLAGAVSLFNVAYVATLAAPFGGWAAVAAAAVLIALNGAGRSASVAVSERTGRRAALLGVLALLALGQVALAGAAATGSVALLVAFVCCAGLGGGGFYPLIASLVREYFGDRRTAEIHGVIYAAKGLGGVIGAGLATVAVVSPSPSTGLAAGGLCLVTLVLARGLRQPGRPDTLPVAQPARS